MSTESPFGGERFPALAARLLMALSVVFLILLIAVAVLLWWGGDRWWPFTVLLFGPRWILGTPFLALIPLALRFGPRAVPVLALGLVVYVVPLMGLNAAFPKMADEGDIQILSVNVADARELLLPLGDLVEGSGADLVAIQECPRRFRRTPGLNIPGYHFHHYLGNCMFSRMPFLSVELMGRNPSEIDSITGFAVRYSMEFTRGDTISVTNVHLPTPRAGLQDIRDGDVAKGVEALQRDTRIRRLAAEGARDLVDRGAGGRIVMGDFNAPPESRIQRGVWGDFRNAFGAAGLGFGFTRYDGWIRARIDHVLVDDGWMVVAAGVGEDVGSDHRPLRVRLRRVP